MIEIDNNQSASSPCHEARTMEYKAEKSRKNNKMPRKSKESNDGSVTQGNTTKCSRVFQCFFVSKYSLLSLISTNFLRLKFQPSYMRQLSRHFCKGQLVQQLWSPRPQAWKNTHKFNLIKQQQFSRINNNKSQIYVKQKGTISTFYFWIR